MPEQDRLNEEANLYKHMDAKWQYGDPTTYRIAGLYLSGAGLVEDWGCGTAFLREFTGAPYRGVDGSWSKWRDIEASLITYRSQVPKTHMRHVLEHNWSWRIILNNFLDSFTDRAVLTLFLKPNPEGDKNVSYGPLSEVPGLSLCEPDLDAILARDGLTVQTSEFHLPLTTPEGWERMYFLEKSR